MELLMVLRWADPRLVFPDEYFYDSDRVLLPTEFNDLIWHPHPYIPNAKATGGIVVMF